MFETIFVIWSFCGLLWFLNYYWNDSHDLNPEVDNIPFKVWMHVLISGLFVWIMFGIFLMNRKK